MANLPLSMYGDEADCLVLLQLCHRIANDHKGTSDLYDTRLRRAPVLLQNRRARRLYKKHLRGFLKRIRIFASLVPFDVCVIVLVVYEDAT